MSQVKEAPAKAAKEPKEKVARTNTLHALLWECYAKGTSFEKVCAMVKEQFPTSKFNASEANQRLHFNYYKVKFNVERKAAGLSICEVKPPAMPKAEKPPKAEKAKAAPTSKKSGKVETVPQGA